MRKFTIGQKVQVKRDNTQAGGIYAGLTGEVINYISKWRYGHPYAVRFSSGEEAWFRASDLEIV